MAGAARPKDLQAQDEEIAVGRLGLCPLALARGDPGEFVPAVEDVLIPGPKHPPPDLEDIPVQGFGLVQVAAICDRPGHFLSHA